jgi:L,D-transpeptidase ErfK/SrfK
MDLSRPAVTGGVRPPPPALLGAALTKLGQARFSGGPIAVAKALLAVAGVYRGAVDDVFDAATATAVMVFQRRNNIPADGVVDERTWRALAT